MYNKLNTKQIAIEIACMLLDILEQIVKKNSGSVVMFEKQVIIDFACQVLNIQNM